MPSSSSAHRNWSLSTPASSSARAVETEDPYSPAMKNQSASGAEEVSEGVMGAIKCSLATGKDCMEPNAAIELWMHHSLVKSRSFLKVEQSASLVHVRDTPVDRQKSLAINDVSEIFILLLHVGLLAR